MRWSCYLSLALFAAACGQPTKHEPAPSATDSEEPPPFDDVSESDKILMGSWGTLVVPKEFHDDPSGAAKMSQGMALDIVYARPGESGMIEGRLTVAHEEKPGVAMVDPEIAKLPGDDVGAVACPGGSIDTGEIVLKKGQRARFQCGRGTKGGGVEATVKQGSRFYHFACVEQGTDAVARCIKYLKTFDPG